MDKKLVDTITATHDEVVTIRAKMEAREEVRKSERKVCEITHQQVDARIAGLARVVKGKDGDAGLVKAHEDLKEAFNGMATKIYIWAVVIGTISSFVASVVVAAVAAHFSR